ncbi:uncharacterized protein N7506_007609 [Penicillium brevicompactum]|uniref:uncharacterized protein n=1 Tax=Penicillium brevicompactum TaxID=5074 RepID=UPI00253FD4B8|nr:uncharacterized protein N7506_007609 [Penicillium brevicompactum]KAJ5333826.1 hypothetical protein N7506_007609 [Penicillium brevicompactum]
MPTYRFLHKPTLQKWFNEFYDTLGAMHDQHNASARIALLFMVFAHARVYMPEDDQPGPSDLSLFGTVSHLALAIGLNRKDSSDLATGLNVVEAECRRRTFWCAYTLDAYLSAALGRPRTFHDNDIDAELPACVEDEDLIAGQVTIPTPPGSTRRPSTMLAALAHMKLAQITGKILSNLYSIKPIPAARQVAAVKEISHELSDWRTELSRFLDVDTVSTSLFLPIFQRQRNVLNMTYWHAIILTHRPYVLSSSARLSQSDEQNDHDIQQNESLRKCLDAAMMTANTISEITESRQLYRAFWNTAYFAFGATIMLYIYVIQECASPPEVYSRYLTAASRCQSHISAIAEKGSLSERYSLVLEELRVEALRQTKRANLCKTGPGGSSRQQEHEVEPMFTHTNEAQVDAPAAADLVHSVMDLNGNIPGLYPDYSGWGQFTSMVSSGLGNMDMFMNCDSLNF